MKHPLAILTSAAFAITVGYLTSSPANASLLGDTVTCSDTVFGNCTPASATVVEPGMEFQQYAATTGIDVGASQITLVNLINTNLSLVFAGILTIGDLDFTPTASIIGFTLTSSSGISGLTQGDLSFTAHSVSINMQGLFLVPGSSAVLTIETSGSSSAPEPATIALLGLGVAALGFARRRGRR